MRIFLTKIVYQLNKHTPSEVSFITYNIHNNNSILGLDIVRFNVNIYIIYYLYRPGQLYWILATGYR